jgi:hypothetical protein
MCVDARISDIVEVAQLCVFGCRLCANWSNDGSFNITAEKAGTVKEIKVAVGDSVGSGDVVVVIE